LRNEAAVKLRAENLTHTYSGRRQSVVTAISDVSLDIREGEFVSLIGPSGCGKSTLLNILVGLENPTRGVVLLDGKENTFRTGRIGYMPQRDLLMPWRSILDNVILGLEIAGTARETARSRASEMFKIFGLAGFEKHYPGELSGGMRQRAAMMRTFLADRDVNLLDEPFGRLDSLTRTALQEWLQSYCENSSKTVLLITHDIDEAIFLSDRIFVMSRRPGTIVRKVDVGIDRPRKYGDAIASPRFVELKRALLNDLRPTGGEI
jgi:ABC-type nitrate/sulfonate/bicarbonate transport system ATPase subunit